MLPRYVPSLDLMPSPLEDKPGLVIRDPFRFSDATLIIPPALIGCLELFDGEHDGLDLRAYLVRLTGDLGAGELEKHLLETLSGAGFLEDDNFEQRKAEVQRAFAEAPLREPVHAGAGYPDEPQELTETLQGYMAGDGAAGVANNPANDSGHDRLLAIAAPHVSPFGGIDAY